MVIRHRHTAYVGVGMLLATCSFACATDEANDTARSRSTVETDEPDTDSVPEGPIATPGGQEREYPPPEIVEMTAEEMASAAAGVQAARDARLSTSAWRERLAEATASIGVQPM